MHTTAEVAAAPGGHDPGPRNPQTCWPAPEPGDKAERRCPGQHRGRQANRTELTRWAVASVPVDLQEQASGASVHSGDYPENQRRQGCCPDHSDRLVPAVAGSSTDNGESLARQRTGRSHNDPCPVRMDNPQHFPVNDQRTRRNCTGPGLKNWRWPGPAQQQHNRGDTSAYEAPSSANRKWLGKSKLAAHWANANRSGKRSASCGSGGKLSFAIAVPIKQPLPLRSRSRFPALVAR
jgi:hypothetical protein